MDSSELNRMLCDRGQELCAMLFPNGKVKGQHYLIGNLQGDAGETLQITISGAAAGRWIDFANKEDKGATFLWLWSKAKGITFREAVQQAKDWLGVKDEDYGIKRHKSKTYSKPEKGGVRILETNCKAMDYIIGERRLDPIAVTKAKVCESDDGEWVIFPYIEKGEDGKEVCVHRKHLKIDRLNGKKEITASKGTKRCLYGKNLIDDNISELIISEGEIDGLSWHSWSLPGVSVPNGVSDFEWVEIDWDWLARFEKIYVCMDMDEPGKLAAVDLCKRLGLHRCYIVTLPKKDVNECLVAGMKREEMQKCLADAKAIELDEIKKPMEYLAEVKELNKTDWTKYGFSTPWYPTIPWRVRKGEFTILTGFSGHGKTPCLNQLMIHLVSQGARVMNASLEVTPAMTLYDMSLCAMAKESLTDQETDACVGWINDSMYFYDCIGTANISRLMHAMEYARKRHGIDVFIIDSLFKCGLGSEDYGSQREFTDKLTTFCNNTGAHVILVAHTRKMSNGNEYSVPTKSDVSGSSDLVNGAFNVIIVWRNLLKCLKLDELRQVVPQDSQKIDQLYKEPDNKFVLEKQKFAKGQTAKVFMFFDPQTNQFHTSKGKKTPYFVLKS